MTKNPMHEMNEKIDNSIVKVLLDSLDFVQTPFQTGCIILYLDCCLKFQTHSLGEKTRYDLLLNP